MSYHQTIVLGNLGADPEITEFPESGNKVCNFSLAVNEEFTTRSGEEKKRTTWYRCSAWNGTGDAIKQYRKKGDPLLVIGTMRFDPVDPEDNTGKGVYPKLIVQRAKFINTGRNGNGGASVTVEQDLVDDEEEIPF